LSELLEFFGRDGGGTAGASWSKAEVLVDGDTGSSSMHIARVFWSPNVSSQDILMTMGDKRTM